MIWGWIIGGVTSSSVSHSSEEPSSLNSISSSSSTRIIFPNWSRGSALSSTSLHLSALVTASHLADPFDRARTSFFFDEIRVDYPTPLLVLAVGSNSRVLLTSRLVRGASTHVQLGGGAARQIGSDIRVGSNFSISTKVSSTFLLNSISIATTFGAEMWTLVFTSFSIKGALSKISSGLPM